jgi:hypothetical protein
MAKLTKEMLDALIKEAMLQERDVKINFPLNYKKDGGKVDDDQAPAKTGLNKSEFSKLASLDGDKSDLTYDDYVSAIDNEKKIFNKLKTQGKSPFDDAAKDADKYYKAGLKTSADVSKVDPAKPMGVTKSRSIGFQTLNTIDADPASSTAMGQFPEGLAVSTQTFFQNENSLFDRINKISKTFDAIFAPGAKKDRLSKLTSVYPDQAELLSGILICDYVSTIVKEADQGAAAYQFEALLAMLSGGRVRGKDQGEVAGQMGAVDFETNAGTKGSAKYYKDYSKISQASGGFKINEPVFYIVALKMKGTAGTGSPSGKKGRRSGSAADDQATSDPREIIKLHIYNMIVMKTDKTDSSGNNQFLIKTSEGDIFEEYVPDGTQLKINKAKYYKKPAVLTVSRVSKAMKDELLQNIEANTDKSSKDYANSIKAMTVALDNSQLATQKIQAYAASGERNTGDEAVRALKAATTETRKLGKAAFGQTGLKEEISQDKETIVENIVKEFLRGQK